MSLQYSYIICMYRIQGTGHLSLSIVLSVYGRETFPFISTSRLRLFPLDLFILQYNLTETSIFVTIVNKGFLEIEIFNFNLYIYKIKFLYMFIRILFQFNLLRHLLDCFNLLSVLFKEFRTRTTIKKQVLQYFESLSIQYLEVNVYFFYYNV